MATIVVSFAAFVAVTMVLFNLCLFGLAYRVFHKMRHEFGFDWMGMSLMLGFPAVAILFDLLVFGWLVVVLV